MVKLSVPHPVDGYIQQADLSPLLVRHLETICLLWHYHTWWDNEVVIMANWKQLICEHPKSQGL